MCWRSRCVGPVDSCAAAENVALKRSEDRWTGALRRQDSRCNFIFSKTPCSDDLVKPPRRAQNHCETTASQTEPQKNHNATTRAPGKPNLLTLCSPRRLDRTRDRGPGTRTRDQGPGTRDQEPGTRDQGPGTRDKGQGTRDQGRGTRDQGPGNRDQGPGTRDHG